MNLTCEEIRCVGVDGLGGLWDTRNDELQKIGGPSFVRITPNNRSLVVIVCDGNAIAHKPVPTHVSLTKSLGLAKLRASGMLSRFRR